MAVFANVVSIKTLPVNQAFVNNLSTESIYDRTAHPASILAIECTKRRCSADLGPQPTKVAVNIYVESMSTLHTDTMDFRVDIYFQQRWHDPRLAHNYDTQSILIRDIVSKMHYKDIFVIFIHFCRRSWTCCGSRTSTLPMHVTHNIMI
jgi:hypothetical protein